MAATPQHRGNLLLIGGSGFASGTIARVAQRRGYRVWAITRGQRQLPEGVTGLEADRHDSAAFERAVDRPGVRWDFVVDCIGFMAPDARQDVAVFRQRAPQLAFISSDFVFDPARRRFPQPEETENYLADDSYGANKRRCELELLNGDCGDMEWTIVRPCHIYGPGSQLGCLPLHGRDPLLIARLRAGEGLKLVGGGYFLQQPIFVRDLANVILSAHGNPNAYRQIYCTAGPDIIESRDYYETVAEVLGVGLEVEEIPVDAYRREHPENVSFLCHRIYSLDKLSAHGLDVPSTPINSGLREHTKSLLP